MKFASLTLAASAALLSAAVANAETYEFTYTGNSMQATGVLEVFNGIATAGSITVTGTAMDGTYSLFAGAGNSPSDQFLFDNAVNADGEQHLTDAGLLFLRGPEEINLSAMAPGSYKLAAWNNGLTEDEGSFIMNVVPGPGAMALLGLGGMVASRRRRA